MQQPRLHWDAQQGWILDVPVSLEFSQLSRVAEWALPHQIDRWRSLPPGEKKEECKRSIEALQKHQIRQRVVNDDGVVFTSTERTDPSKTYFI